MKPKMRLKIGIDLAMTILLPCQMAYMLIGEAAHEWMGTGMFALFILHHILNWQWYKNLRKGVYSPLRILQTALNFLVLFSMLGLMISGVMLSRTVFAFIPIHGGMSIARTLHMLASYWGLIFMSLHIGMHWAMVMAMARRIGKTTKSSRRRSFLLRALALVVCLYGIYALNKHQIPDYLFLRSQFVFFDMNQPLPLFFAEYFAIMGLWICLAYYISKAIQFQSRQTIKQRG